jgi:hypothetical protein
MQTLETQREVRVVAAVLAQRVQATRKEIDSARRQLTVLLTGELAAAKVSGKENQDSEERHKAVSWSELVARSGRFQWRLCYV